MKRRYPRGFCRAFGLVHAGKIVIVHLYSVAPRPRFAANLGYLFTEQPFLDRFGAAKRAGFEGVEFASPYEFEADAIAQRLNDNNLACVLFNLPMGDRAKGDFGIACLPGREAEFDYQLPQPMLAGVSTARLKSQLTSRYIRPSL